MEASNQRPDTVHWRINCLCDTRCSFCYGPEALHEVDPENCIPVLDKMVDFGIRSFIITGGEPLLSRRIDPVIRHLHGRGVGITLYTNCTYWDFHDEVLTECVSTLCVPVEGASEAVHDSVRGFNSLRAVESVLDRYAQKDGPFTVCAGTVVGRHNLNELRAILYLLDRYELGHWTLYHYPRYTDRVLGKHFREQQLTVSLAEYEEAVESLLAVEGRRTDVRLASDLERESRFYMMSPELDIVIPTRESNGALTDRVLCSAEQASMTEIEGLWQGSVNWERFHQNLNVSL